MSFDQAGGVVCLGETMVVLVPAEPGPAHEVVRWTRAIGGAESNVACHLARLGVASAWVSAVGADAFGQAVLDAVGGVGVDVTGVRVDPERPTGLYVKEADAAGSPVRYYRRGSAASAMGPETLDGLDLTTVRLVHVSGITAALSDSCLALLRAVLTRPRNGLQVSFDLNWR
ncbi:MAG: PfkB family carbohydrate kinase, partial [Umezawaea sp.]